MTDRDPVPHRSRAVPPARRRRTVLPLLAVAALLATVPFTGRDARAATRQPGAGELILDAPAVAAIIESGIPDPIPFTVPPIGRITVVLTAPDEVVFRKGGLEAKLGIAVPEVGVRGFVDLRYEPEIDERDGVAMLRPVRCKPGGMLAMVPDLAKFLPPVSVPSGFERDLHPRGGSRTTIRIDVREVAVVDQRLVLRLGLSSVHEDEPAAPPKSES